MSSIITFSEKDSTGFVGLTNPIYNFSLVTVSFNGGTTEQLPGSSKAVLRELPGQPIQISLSKSTKFFQLVGAPNATYEVTMVTAAGAVAVDHAHFVGSPTTGETIPLTAGSNDPNTWIKSVTINALTSGSNWIDEIRFDQNDSVTGQLHGISNGLPEIVVPTDITPSGGFTLQNSVGGQYLLTTADQTPTSDTIQFHNAVAGTITFTLSMEGRTYVYAPPTVYAAGDHTLQLEVTNTPSPISYTLTASAVAATPDRTSLILDNVERMANFITQTDEARKHLLIFVDAFTQLSGQLHMTASEDLLFLQRFLSHRLVKQYFGPAAEAMDAILHASDAAQRVQSGDVKGLIVGALSKFEDLAFTTAGAQVGVLTGAAIGSVIIPANVLTGFVGSVVGGLAGSGIGHIVFDQFIKADMEKTIGDLVDRYIVPVAGDTVLRFDLGGSGSESASPGQLAAQAAPNSTPTFDPVGHGLPITPFDASFYLANHSDAAAAVASGTFSSAYAYYVAVGVDRGDRPSAGAAPLAATDVPDLPILKTSLNGFAPLYSGIFDLAIGSLPTDGVSAAEHQVGQHAFGPHGAVEDASLSALADRVAIDLARNQHFSGKFPVTLGATLSNGASVFDLERLAAPDFNILTVYIVPQRLIDSVSDMDALFPIIVSGSSIGNAYGIAEYGGVWIAYTANTKAGGVVHQAPTESGGSALINFYGTNDDDVIFLGAHAGTALGGPGNDVILGSAGIDRAVFSGHRADYTISYSASQAKVTGPDGVDTLTNVEFLAFDDVTIATPTKPPHWSASVDIGTHPAGWLPAGVGDFNNDGTGDLLWYNQASGDAEVWKLANGKWAGSVDIGLHPAGWAPAGVGDVNHDGTSDVLWFNPGNRDVEVWKIANGQWAGSVDIGTHPAGWAPSGVGDFNGDGTSDVLWYNSANGDAEVWQISNGHWAGSVDIGTHPAGWRPAGIGDFSGDGISDVLWYNAATGDAEVWKISNGHWAGSVDIGVHPAGWVPVGVTDFNQDGTSDVGWFNAANGNVDIWQIANAHWAGSFDIGPHPVGSVPVGVGDFNRDGVSDMLWRDANTGRIETWLLANS